MNLDQINMSDYHTQLPIDFKKEVKKWKKGLDRKMILKKKLIKTYEHKKEEIVKKRSKT